MLKNSKQFMPTFIIIAVNVFVFACTSLLSGDIVTSDRVMAALGQDNYAIANGEIWRFFTSMFVHADVVHLFGNMLFLLIFGLRAEEMFDLREYLAIYFLSGLAGGILTFIFWFDSLSVGASGAIFGIFGASVIYVKRAIGQSIMTALIYAFFLFFLNIGGNVNYLAHLGGLAVGLLMGYMLATRRAPRLGTGYRYSYSYSTNSRPSDASRTAMYNRLQPIFAP